MKIDHSNSNMNDKSGTYENASSDKSMNISGMLNISNIIDKSTQNYASKQK